MTALARVSSPSRLRPHQLTDIVHYTALAVIVAVGAALRLTALSRQSLWFDEVDAVIRAQRPFGDVLRTFTTAGENGPLYNLLLAVWIRFAGISEIAVRFPSALAGTLTIPLLYLLVRRVATPLHGLIAAGLLSISPYHIWYSQEAKMYALLVLLATCSTYLYVLALEQNKPRWWIAWVVVTSLMFYTHVVSVLVFVAQCLYALLTAGVWRTRRRAWLLSVAALVLPYIPIALWATRVVKGDVATWQPDVNVWEAARIVAIKFAVNRYDVAIEHRAALLYVALAVVGAVGLALPRQRERWWLLLVALAIIPVLGIWAVSLRQSVFSDRYVIVALPAWLALVASGVVLLITGKRLWPLGVLATLLILTFAWGPIRDVNRSCTAEKEDWRSAWAAVNRDAQRGDVIVIHPGYLITTRDYFAQREPGLTRFRVGTIPSFAVGWLDDEIMVHLLEEQISGAQRIWLVQSPDRVPAEDPDGALEAWLRSNGEPLSETEYNGVRVTLYDAPPLAP
jgi:mannosyltransferase